MLRGPFDNDDAACARACAEGYAEYDDWFPQSRAVDEWSRARAICRNCPVMAECYEWAVANGVRGVWGGVYLPGTGRKHLTSTLEIVPKRW